MIQYMLGWIDSSGANIVKFARWKNTFSENSLIFIYPEQIYYAFAFVNPFCKQVLSNIFIFASAEVIPLSD